MGGVFTNRLGHAVCPLIFGRVLGLRDAITFQEETVAEARQAFQDSVDDYLELCARRGEEPEKSYSGKFVVRVKPELHRALVQAAEVFGMSLNALVEGVLEDRFLFPSENAMSSKRLLPTGACWCGCGTEVGPGSFFAPGHDKWAEGFVTKTRYGSVAGYLDAHGFGPNGKNARAASASPKAASRRQEAGGPPGLGRAPGAS